ncbi:MAG: MFS transporter [Pseudomonadota bacterium]
MSSPLQNPEFRKLFAAQIFSLLGIGVMTVSLSLSAFEFGGVSMGGPILGGILALKMVAYVLIAPLAEPLTSSWPRRRVLVIMDVLRLALVAGMGFAQTPLQVAVLAFLFFAVSSGFTPLFQAVLTEILPDEASYVRALAWSRVAYTLEAVLSPVVAALALNLLVPSDLFFVAGISFCGSVAALLLTHLPAALRPAKSPFLLRLTRGARIYARTPRLRGLWLFQFAVSLLMAWVFVNTVIYAGSRFSAAESIFTWQMASYGLGAAAMALIVPRMVEMSDERRVMAAGAFCFAGLGLLIAAHLPLAGLMALWLAFGAAGSLVLTPGGLVIARSASQENRPAVFAAQFALSHAGWLLAYPLAGWLGALLSPATALLLLCLACALLTGVALRVWPATDVDAPEHDHPELPPDHPHIRAHSSEGGGHRHRYYIDDLHPHWPGVAT